MISLKNFERLQELQQQIVWQSVLELEPRTLVPEASIYLSSSNALGLKCIHVDLPGFLQNCIIS